VCLALFAATGLLIRVTADDLYHRVFTVKNPDRNMIRAAFFIDSKSGKATHTAGILDNGIILNSQEGGARVRMLEEIAVGFWNEGTSTAVRGLDHKALIVLAEKGQNRFGLDPELAKYFEAVYE
jgi:murein DD-endopeptidase